MALVMVLGCRGTGEVPPALTPLPSGSPAAMLQGCAAERYPELAIGCRVEAAAQAANVGDLETVTAACDGVPEGKWRDECHFRAGEQLGKAGRTDPSLAQCAQAGDFGRFCITHAGWGLPASDTRAPAELAALASGVIPGALGLDAARVLRSRAWFNRFVGTGLADPALARAARGEDIAPAHTAWAIEAVRLALVGSQVGGADPGHAVDVARAVWRAGTSLSGVVLPIAARVGRYDTFPDFAGEAALPHVLTFADASRFVGADLDPGSTSPDEDIEIALIEGLYYNLPAGARDPELGRPFARWLDDPRPRVRYTALRRFRALPSTGVEDRLRAMAEDPDPIVRAHVADALKYQTWRGRKF